MFYFDGNFIHGRFFECRNLKCLTADVRFNREYYCLNQVVYINKVPRLSAVTVYFKGFACKGLFEKFCDNAAFVF